jgi:hypothetical protein
LQKGEFENSGPSLEAGKQKAAATASSLLISANSNSNAKSKANNTASKPAIRIVAVFS